MTLVKDRMNGSKFSAAELFYNARWRELVAARCALEGATCGERDPAVVEGSAFVARLRLAVSDAEWKYAEAVRDVESRLGRAMTDEERMVGFGKVHPDGALSEARPWDANYLPPGMTWKPEPMPPRDRRWKMLAGVGVPLPAGVLHSEACDCRECIPEEEAR